MRRRKPFNDVRDSREIIMTSRGEMTCEFYKQVGPVPTMRAVDSMPEEYRKLVHEFGIDVWSDWKHGLSIAAIRKKHQGARAAA